MRKTLVTSSLFSCLAAGLVAIDLRAGDPDCNDTKPTTPKNHMCNTSKGVTCENKFAQTLPCSGTWAEGNGTANFACTDPPTPGKTPPTVRCGPHMVPKQYPTGDPNNPTQIVWEPVMAQCYTLWPCQQSDDPKRCLTLYSAGHKVEASTTHSVPCAVPNGGGRK